MSTYITQVACPGCGKDLVEAKGLPHGLDVDPETANDIDDAVEEGEGRVTLTPDEVRRNEWNFTDDEIRDAKQQGGHQLNIWVPECNLCGTDQDSKDTDD
ncbi:MAG: Uncharacterized protein AWU57_506 [Marinobacter sp. T13-3]|nr:MAG: Uncharacterized protein AWU57_506 [Marinobacter sp. T13-3]